MRKSELGWSVVVMAFVLWLSVSGVAAQGIPGDSPLATPTLAAWNPDAGELPTDPRGVLVWLVSGGAVIVANALLAYAYARWPWFAALDGFEKRALAWGTSIVLSCAAYGLLHLSGAFWARVLEFWPLFLSVAVGLAVNQTWYHTREKPTAEQNGNS